MQNNQQHCLVLIEVVADKRIENPPPETAQLEGGSSAIESSASPAKIGEPLAIPDNLKTTVPRLLNEDNWPCTKQNGRG